MQSNTRKFLESWSTQLLSKSDQVRDLIGSKHWLTDGRHKENILKQFISEHIPAVCQINSGFILPITEPEKVSREIDIIITDSRINSRVFTSADVIISPPEGIVAHIHVKSTLTGPSLKDALETAISSSDALGFHQATCAIFFYTNASHKSETAELDFFTRKKKLFKELLNKQAVLDFVLCIAPDTLLVGKRSSSERPALLQCYHLPRLATGAFMANLSNSVETILKNTSTRSDLTRRIVQLATEPVFTIEL